MSESANQRTSEPRNSPFGTLVLGLGNPLRGDDGVGPRVVEELTRRGLPEGVMALDVGTGGLNLLQLIEGWKRVVIVDAADIEREAGQFVRFTSDQVRLAQATDSFSLHNAGLSEVLALADALGRPLPEMVVYGVQLAEVGWGEGLSPAVEAALPVLIDAIFEVIEETKGENYAKNLGG